MTIEMEVVDVLDEVLWSNPSYAGPVPREGDYVFGHCVERVEWNFHFTQRPAVKVIVATVDL